MVIESGKTTLRDLYTKEDWMAIWLGFIRLIAGVVMFLCLAGLAVALAIFFGIGRAIMRDSFFRFFIGFFFVFVLAVLAYMGKMQTDMKHWGFAFRYGLSSWACSSAIHSARPGGLCLRFRRSSTSKPVWCCWELKSFSTRSWPSANRAYLWPGSARPSRWW